MRAGLPEAASSSGKVAIKMDSSVGLAIQCVGIVLVTVLTFSMRASIRNASLKYWTTAWSCLSLSLLSLFIGFHVVTDQKFFYAIYFLGEYAFGFMFMAGCRYHSAGELLRPRHLFLLVPAIAIATVLPFLSRDFNDLFMVQATIMAALFASCLWALRPAYVRKEASPGLRVTSVALLQENAKPSECQIREAISGNMCRCTGYVKIVEAIQKASQEISGKNGHGRK